MHIAAAAMLPPSPMLLRVSAGLSRPTLRHTPTGVSHRLLRWIAAWVSFTGLGWGETAMEPHPRWGAVVWRRRELGQKMGGEQLSKWRHAGSRSWLPLQFPNKTIILLDEIYQSG